MKTIAVSFDITNNLKITLRVFTPFTVVSEILVLRPGLPKALPIYLSSNRGNSILQSREYPTSNRGNIHPPIEGISILQSREYPSSNRGNIPGTRCFWACRVVGVWSPWAVSRAVTKKATPFEGS